MSVFFPCCGNEGSKEDKEMPQIGSLSQYMEDSGELPDPAEYFSGVIKKLLLCWAVVDERERRQRRGLRAGPGSFGYFPLCVDSV